jgi:hypothetical protein
MNKVNIEEIGFFTFSTSLLLVLLKKYNFETSMFILSDLAYVSYEKRLYDTIDNQEYYKKHFKTCQITQV